MRRLGVAGALLALLALLAGCQNVVGPFQRGAQPRVDDPGVTLYEQQRRSRDQLALPDDSGLVAPRSSAVGPGSSALEAK